MKNMRNIFIDWYTAIDQPEVAFMKKSANKVAAKIFIKFLKKSVVMRHEFLGDTYALKEQLEIK